jgi:hypothetical protein
MNYELTNVKYDLTSTIYFALEVEAHDGGFSTAWVSGQLIVGYNVNGPMYGMSQEFIFPPFSEAILYAEDMSRRLTGVTAYDVFRSEYIPFNQSYEYDPSEFDVVSFDVLVDHVDIAILRGWGDGDYRVHSLVRSHWIGDISLDYIYESTSAVPIPTTLLLLGSGLIAIAGFRRKNFEK